MLVPRAGNFSALQTMAKNVFTTNALVQEPARVEIQNGTAVSGLAAKTATELQKRGYLVVHVSNAPERNSAETIIYDFTNGAKPTSLAALRMIFNAKVAPVMPTWLIPGAESLDPSIRGAQNYPQPNASTDFLIIIGEDNAATFTSSLHSRFN